MQETVKKSRRDPIFHPKILSSLKNYSMNLFFGDAVSGVIVGIVAIPLAIAFAIASGVSPEKGLVTTIVAGFLISCLGGSRVQIGGPTGAFVIIVYGIVNTYGENGLFICTIMAGVILIGMGLLGLGSLMKYVPYPLVVGFTSGIAVIIFSSQVKDALGLDIDVVPPGFLDKWNVIIRNFETINSTTALLFFGSILIILLWQKFIKKIPGSIVAIILLTLLTHNLGLDVETIGSRFGDLSLGFPMPKVPSVNFSDVSLLVRPALVVAILAGIESLLSATVADGMIEGKSRSNTELIAQGFANIATPFFGGIPATGAIARTATNIRNGGRTPIAGIIHAGTVLFVLLLFGQWAALIPMPVLAAILVIVSYHMSEWHAFKSLLRAPRMDVLVMVSTFLLTILIDLTVAIEVGMVLSAILFMKRMTDVTRVREITEGMDRFFDEDDLRSAADATTRRVIPPGIRVYEAEGALFFGVAEILRSNLDFGDAPPNVLVFRMRHVLALDASGMRAIQDLWRTCKKHGTNLVLSGVHSQPREAMIKSGLMDVIGKENVKDSFDQAMKRAEELSLPKN